MKHLAFKAALLAGFACIIGGVVNHWFTIPMQNIAREQNGFITETSVFQAPFQIIIAAVAATIFAVAIFSYFRLYNYSYSKVLSLAAHICFLAVLLFPYLVMVWDYEHSLQAVSLYKQAVYLNEQVALGFQWIQVDWMKGTKLDPFYPSYWNYETFPLLYTPPAIFRVLRTDPIFGSVVTHISEYGISPLQPSLIDSYIYGLGYSDTFFQFARSGYFLTALGGIFLILSVCLLEREPIKWLGVNIASLTGLWLFLIVLYSIPILVTFRLLDKADTLAAQGQYGLAIHTLNKATNAMPVLNCNLSFHYFRGQLYALTNQVYEPDYYLFLGVQKIKDGQREKAIFDFRRALTLDHGIHHLLNSMLAGLLLDEGIAAFNNGHFDIASRQWHDILHMEPFHLAAISHMAVGEIAQGNTESARDYAEQALRIQSYFQKPFKPISSQVLLIKAWSFFKDNNLPTALYYLVTSKNVSQLAKPHFK